MALAAAWAWRLRGSEPPKTRDFLDLLLPDVPDSQVAAGIRRAQRLREDAPLQAVVDSLGNGSEVSAQDTVPFVLWSAARHLDDYEEALWQTVSGLGDMDTTCAMVGGIVALYTGVGAIPEEWRRIREPLPDWVVQRLMPAE